MDTSFIETLKDSNSSLPKQAADRISRLIIEQHLTEGDKLPNEFDLATKLNVGRGTIREAVKLLVSRNVLVIRRGVGTYIAKHPGQIEDPLGFAFYPDQVKLCMDLLEVRAHLEPWVAAVAAQRGTDEDIQRMQDACRLVEKDIEENRDHLAHDKVFHVCVARCTKNLVVPNLIPIITYSVGLFGKLTENALRHETLIDHRAVVDAISHHDPSGAESAMRQHLEKNRAELERVMQEMDTKNAG